MINITAFVDFFFVEKIAFGLNKIKAQSTKYQERNKRTHRQVYANRFWQLEHRVPPPTPVCYIASSASILTKRGVGTPHLTVVLAEARIPFNSAQLSSSRRRGWVTGLGVRGKKSFAMAVKSRQHAAAVELVTRPMCPSTALICFLVQRARSGWRE